jgi:hypothetical protein
MRLYPSAAHFRVLDPEPFDDAVHFGGSTNADPYHCEASGHRLNLTLINHTPFGYLINVAGMTAIGHPFSGERRFSTSEVMPPSITDPKPITVTVTLHQGDGAADVVRRMCPDRILQYAVPPYLSTVARVTAMAVADTEDHHEMCQGKRLFQISTDMPTPNPLLYFTQNDPDLGTGQVMDGGSYYLTVGRAASVILYIHHSVDNHHIGVTTGCTIEIPASEFAAHWVPASPTATMASSKPSGCHPVGASQITSGTGELLVATAAAQTVQLLGPRGTIYHSGYPTVAPGLHREAVIDLFEPPRRLRLIYLSPPELPVFEGVVVDDILLEADGAGTIVRLLCSGMPDMPEWTGYYSRVRMLAERSMARLKVLCEMRERAARVPSGTAS